VNGARERPHGVRADVIEAKIDFTAEISACIERPGRSRQTLQRAFGLGGGP
jgi:hypothetical protein